MWSTASLWNIECLSRSRRTFTSNAKGTDSSFDKVMPLEQKYVDDATPEKLLELTATYWRRLRCAKPLLLTCNIDKAVECRVVDSVLGTGASCVSSPDPNSLMEKLLLHKESQGIIGCYINIDSLDPKIGQYKNAFEVMDSCCNAIMVDINIPPEAQDTGFSYIDEMLHMVKPQVIRFVNGTWNYVACMAPEQITPRAQEHTDIARLHRCDIISQKHKALVIDCDAYPVMMNASEFEGVIFSRSPSILKKIYGFDVMTGAIIATILSASSSNAMLACITSIMGIDYSSAKCADASEGPASLAINFIDKVHRISTSPDTLLDHDSPVRFVKRVHVPVGTPEGPQGNSSD